MHSQNCCDGEQHISQLISQERGIYGFMSKQSTCMYFYCMPTLNGWTWSANKNRCGIYVGFAIPFDMFFPMHARSSRQSLSLEENAKA